MLDHMTQSVATTHDPFPMSETGFQCFMDCLYARKVVHISQISLHALLITTESYS